MNTRRVVLTIFAVLIALGLSIPCANAQPELNLMLLLPGVDADGNLDYWLGGWGEVIFLGSENRLQIICRADVTNNSGKACIENPYIRDVDGCCIVGLLVISASGHGHLTGEFQCPSE
jgi:hypothetical protein